MRGSQSANARSRSGDVRFMMATVASPNQQTPQLAQFAFY
jgi:hypothetical protein